jgi:hypothetical protein
MRTTIRLPDDLMKAVKRRAVETGRTPTGVIEDAVRAALAPEEAALSRGPVTVPTYGAGGVLPGVDLDDTASLLRRMEGEA